MADIPQPPGFGIWERLTGPLRGIFNEFSNFASSVGGGFVLSLASAAEADRVFAEFTAGLDEDKREMARQLGELIGVGGPTQQVHSSVTSPESLQRLRDAGIDPNEFVAQIQGHIDAGTAPPEWMGQFTEEVSNPFSALERAFAAGAEGEALSEEFFDPSSAVGRFEELFDPISEGFEALPSQVGAANEDLQRLYASLRGELQTGAADIAGGFEDILGTATGLVSTLGETERADINRRFTEAGTEAQMFLAARGQGGSAALDLSSRTERERSTALLTLQDQITRQQLDVQETFGLAGLSAQERLLAGGVNLGAQQAGAQQFGSSLFATTASNALSNRGNIAAGEFSAFDQAATQRFNSFMAAAGFPIQTQLSAAELALRFYADTPVVAPGSNQQNPIQLQLPVRP